MFKHFVTILMLVQVPLISAEMNNCANCIANSKIWCYNEFEAFCIDQYIPDIMCKEFILDAVFCFENLSLVSESISNTYDIDLTQLEENHTNYYLENLTVLNGNCMKQLTSANQRLVLLDLQMLELNRNFTCVFESFQILCSEHNELKRRTNLDKYRLEQQISDLEGNVSLYVSNNSKLQKGLIDQNILSKHSHRNLTNKLGQAESALKVMGLESSMLIWKIGNMTIDFQNSKRMMNDSFTTLTRNFSNTKKNLDALQVRFSNSQDFLFHRQEDNILLRKQVEIKLNSINVLREDILNLTVKMEICETSHSDMSNKIQNFSLIELVLKTRVQTLTANLIYANTRCQELEKTLNQLQSDELSSTARIQFVEVKTRPSQIADHCDECYTILTVVWISCAIIILTLIPIVAFVTKVILGRRSAYNLHKWRAELSKSLITDANRINSTAHEDFEMTECSPRP